MTRSEYFYPSENMYIRTEQFSQYDTDDLIEIMHHWFYENYDNPANICPYDEGEYIYIYGSPVTLVGAMTEEFEDCINNEVITEAIERIGNAYAYDDWSPTPDADWTGYSINNPSHIFYQHIEDIKRLSAVHNSSPSLQSKYLSLLFSNAVTALETFLADELILILDRDTECRQKFVERTFKESLRDSLLSEYEKYKPKYVQKVYEISFHNRRKIENIFMYSTNLAIPLEDLDELEKIAHQRHNIIHRNGKNKDGEDILTSDTDLEWCISRALNIVNYIKDEQDGEIIDDSPDTEQDF